MSKIDVGDKRALSAAIDTRIALLSQAVDAAESRWSSMRARLLARSESDQVLGSLRSIRKLSSAWVSAGIRLKDTAFGLEDGQARVDSWIESGNQQIKNVRELAEDVATVGLDRIVLQTARVTAVTVAKAPIAAVAAVGGVAGTVWESRRWVTVAVAAVAAVYLVRMLRSARAVAGAA